MSLINDALRRAQENLPPPAPSSGPELRPVEQDHSSVRTAGLLLPVTLALLALVAMFGFWQVSKGRDKSRQPVVPVRARSAQPVPAPAQKVETAPIQAAAPVSPAVVSTEVASLPSKPGAEPLAPETATNSELQVLQPIAPTPLKLQSIVFSHRPTAMISGQIVAPGDKFHEYTVKEIQAQRVLLSANGETIILTLR